MEANAETPERSPTSTDTPVRTRGDARERRGEDGTGTARGASSGVAWAADALVATAVVGLVAKVLGVIVVPGMRGMVAEGTMVAAETASATFGYVFAALLVALVCGGSFELARARNISLFVRGTVVAIAGIVVALASPAVVQRLFSWAALGCAVVTSLLALLAGAASLRMAHTRAVGGVLALLAVAGFFRPVGWVMVVFAGERANMSLYDVGRTLGAVSVVVQVMALLLASIWLSSRSLLRGRILANLALVTAFALTWLAARENEGAPLPLVAMLRSSLVQAASTTPIPGIATVAAFLVPASLLLAAVALVQKIVPKAILVALSLALVSAGSLDVPLQALAATAASQWLLLAMADKRAMWASLGAKTR